MAALQKRGQPEKELPPLGSPQTSREEVASGNVPFPTPKARMRLGEVFSRLRKHYKKRKTVLKHVSWNAEVCRQSNVSESVRRMLSPRKPKHYSLPVEMTRGGFTDAELAKLGSYISDDLRQHMGVSNRDSGSSSRPISHVSISGSSTLTAGSLETETDVALLVKREDAVYQCKHDQDPFTFDATIVFNPKSGNECPMRVSCRGKLDTGSEENWISRKLIAGTDLEHYRMKLVERPKAYQAFGGSVFFPIGQVDIQWYLDDDLEKLTSTFLVGDDVPFEMVVGSKLIRQEHLLVRPGSVLGIRVVDPTAEELAQMQREAETGARSCRELMAIKNARKDQAARRRELERELHRQATAATSGTTSTAGSGMPTVPAQP